MHVASPFGFLGPLTDALQTAVQGFLSSSRSSSCVGDVDCPTDGPGSRLPKPAQIHVQCFGETEGWLQARIDGEHIG